jgi:hypothetical protein
MAIRLWITFDQINILSITIKYVDIWRLHYGKNYVIKHSLTKSSGPSQMDKFLA